MVRHGYRVGLPHGGHWQERLNTDSSHYGGSNVGLHGRVLADDLAQHDQRWSADLTLPPLAVLWLQPVQA
jgi:1,4-alpha-glucan branching enzyme